jgi:aryl-alcohol dehydrogenase-like predicted oxidoreductase
MMPAPTMPLPSRMVQACREGLAVELNCSSVGVWHNFGDDRPLETQRAIIRRALDLGITHLDLVNNYGGEAPR